MKLLNYIVEAENKFLILLESFFNETWGETKLWSHDLSHHRRVWKYASELLSYDKVLACDNIFLEKLLISCYLHDIGMAIDPGERHGQHSRILCEKFFKENNLKLSDYTDVLEAIENHDNKEYANPLSQGRLLIYLSVADDLDAFGYIGIYRYLEIYLARGVPPKEIGRLVRGNADKRFRHFQDHFSNYPELVEKHRQRFIGLINFFEKYDSELDSFPVNK